MGVTIELNAGTCKRYKRSQLRGVAVRAIAAAKKIDLAEKNITVSVAIVDEAEIRRVNRDFRKKDRVTDVISVGDYSDDRDIATEKSRDIFLGEIILCYNYIAQVARKNHTSIDEEFHAVYVHGMLHLLGFDHGKKMFALQDAICSDINSHILHL